MKHYTNQFQGFTTVVVEVESTLPQYQVDAVIDIMNDLAFNKFKPSCYAQPLQVINKHDEDICIGHKFAVLSQHSEFTIQSCISDIAEIVSTGKLLNDTGKDLLEQYKQPA